MIAAHAVTIDDADLFTILPAHTIETTPAVTVLDLKKSNWEPQLITHFPYYPDNARCHCAGSEKEKFGDTVHNTIPIVLERLHARNIICLRETLQ